MVGRPPVHLFSQLTYNGCVSQNAGKEAWAGGSPAGESPMAAKNGGRYIISEIQNNLAAQPRRPLDDKILATLSGRDLQPNRGIALNLDWIEEVRVNTSAVERCAQTLVTRRTVKKEWQAAWLLRAITCMDLTTRSGDDTEERV